MILSIWVALLVGGIGAFFLLAYIYEWMRHMHLMDKLPGPKPLPILRNLLDLHCEDDVFWRKLRKWSKEYGPLYNISAWHFPSINISGPEEFEIIASTMKNIEKGNVYLFLRKWLGEGLLTSTGSHWQTRRKILTPAFHFSILQQFVGVFNKETERLVRVLKKETSKPWTNTLPLISEFTLYTISETSMGTKLNMHNQEDKDYVSSIYKIGKLLFRRLKKPWLYAAPIYYYLTPVGYEERKIINVMHKFTDKIISLRSKDFEKFEVPQDEYNYSQKKKLAFLDLLLNAQKGEGVIDEKGIRDEVNTFMFEGHDTTSTSICFTLMLLANHKDYQEKVYEEMLAIIGPTKTPSIAELNELKVTERVIKESLRLYPSVPFIGRHLEDDTVIGGYRLPKKAVVNVHIFDIHRNERHWPEPDAFLPDRFLPAASAGRHPFAYVPFSAGPRNCIAELNDLKVTERVIKESLRLYPSVPFIGRHLEDDTVIGGYRLPKKAVVNVHIFDIHRNERHWPEPDAFLPDRFLPAASAGRNPFAYVPFSAGPRNCIGQKFAILELKAVLCGILRNFELDPIDTPDTIILVPDIILRTQNTSVQVKFKLRNV